MELAEGALALGFAAVVVGVVAIVLVLRFSVQWHSHGSSSASGWTSSCNSSWSPPTGGGLISGLQVIGTTSFNLGPVNEAVLVDAKVGIVVGQSAFDGAHPLVARSSSFYGVDESLDRLALPISVPMKLAALTVHAAGVTAGPSSNS